MKKIFHLRKNITERFCKKIYKFLDRKNALCDDARKSIFRILGNKDQELAISVPKKIQPSITRGAFFTLTKVTIKRENFYEKPFIIVSATLDDDIINRQIAHLINREIGKEYCFLLDENLFNEDSLLSIVASVELQKQINRKLS